MLSPPESPIQMSSRMALTGTTDHHAASPNPLDGRVVVGEMAGEVTPITRS